MGHHSGLEAQGDTKGILQQNFGQVRILGGFNAQSKAVEGPRTGHS